MNSGYVAIVYYNDNPVAFEFDGEGEFVRILEQRLQQASPVKSCLGAWFIIAL